jgi:hypothetical protein
MRVKVNSPVGSDSPARPIGRDSVCSGARRRCPPPPKGGRLPKGEVPPGVVRGPKGSGRCPCAGKSASAMSSSGSAARSNLDLKFEV